MAMLLPHPQMPKRKADLLVRIGIKNSWKYEKDYYYLTALMYL